MARVLELQGAQLKRKLQEHDDLEAHARLVRQHAANYDDQRPPLFLSQLEQAVDTGLKQHALHPHAWASISVVDEPGKGLGAVAKVDLQSGQGLGCLCADAQRLVGPQDGHEYES